MEQEQGPSVSEARVIRRARDWRQKKKEMLGATDAERGEKRRALWAAERELDHAVDVMEHKGVPP